MFLNIIPILLWQRKGGEVKSNINERSWDVLMTIQGVKSQYRL